MIRDDEKKSSPEQKVSRFEFFRRQPDYFRNIPRWIKGLFAIFAAIVVLYFFLGGRFGLVNYMRYKHYERTLEHKLASEKARADSLRDLIDKLQKDTLFIESIARERLNMIKPGEKVIIFKENDNIPALLDDVEIVPTTIDNPMPRPDTIATNDSIDPGT